MSRIYVEARIDLTKNGGPVRDYRIIPRTYKSIILPLVLYGLETWSLALRQKHRLKVFDNMVLRRLFGPKRDEVAGGWRKPRDLYSSSCTIRIIKSRRMRWAGHVAQMGKRNVLRLLVGEPEGNRSLGRPRRRWVDVAGIGWGGVDWIGLDQDRYRWRALVNAVMNLRVP
jgi:hypothetical protein